VGRNSSEVPSQPSADAREEIKVIGERADRSLRKTPSSVAVVTAADLERRPDADRLETVLEQIPNIQYGTGGQGPTVRGHDSTGVLQDLPAFLGGTRPRLTLQIDGRAAGFNEFIFGVAPLWDVQQVEVFRSPQTTTQGRNSIAGAIFIQTKDPTFIWEGKARALAGTLATQQLSAVASGPLFDDQLAFRLAGDVRRGRPSTQLADVHAGANPNRDDFKLIRLKLLGEPRAWPGARLEASFSRTDSQMPQIEGIRAPFRERRDPLAPYGVFRAEVNAFTASLEAKVSDEMRSRSIVSIGQSHIDRFAPAGLGEAQNRVSDWSFESTASWAPHGEIAIVGGVHHLRSTLKQAIDLSAILGVGKFEDRQQSWGLFGEAAFTVVDKLTLTAGGRYQFDEQAREGGIGQALASGDIAYERSFSAWLPKLSLAYAFGPEANAGILVQRASNPGGVTLDFDALAQTKFNSESLWSYEAFVRLGVGSRWSLDANVFYQRLQDAQRASPRSFTLPGRGTLIWSQIRNVEKAENYGLEASVRWRPSRFLEVRGAAGHLRTRILNYSGSSSEVGHLEFQRSPHWTLSAEAHWTPVVRLSLSAAVKHNSGYFSDDANTAVRAIGPARTVDVRAVYRAGRSRIFGYARNLLDQFEMTYLFTPVFGTATKPRELGIGFETHF
jgi:outer membrane receptor protein involved in Fe transport